MSQLREDTSSRGRRLYPRRSRNHIRVLTYGPHAAAVAVLAAISVMVVHDAQSWSPVPRSDTLRRDAVAAAVALTACFALRALASYRKGTRLAEAAERDPDWAAWATDAGQELAFLRRRAALRAERRAALNPARNAAGIAVLAWAALPDRGASDLTQLVAVLTLASGIGLSCLAPILQRLIAAAGDFDDGAVLGDDLLWAADHVRLDAAPAAAALTDAGDVLLLRLGVEPRSLTAAAVREVARDTPRQNLLEIVSVTRLAAGDTTAGRAPRT